MSAEVERLVALAHAKAEEIGAVVLPDGSVQLPPSIRPLSDAQADELLTIGGAR